MADLSALKDGKDILDLWADMKEERRPLEPDYRDVLKYVMPSLSPFDEDSGVGNPNRLSSAPVRSQIFDSTAIKSNRRMGNGLMGFTMSPNTRWFVLGLFGKYGEPIRVGDVPGAGRWLRLVEDTLFSVFARSNFYDQGADMNQLAGAFGSPTMWAEPPRHDADPWAFQCLHPKSVWFAEDGRKHINLWVRSLRLQGGDLVRYFGDNLRGKGAKMDSLMREWKEFPRKWHTVLHTIYPNDEFDPGRVDKKGKKNRSVYTDLEGNILEDGGTDHSGYLTWRWQTNSDQIYSGSISMDAMPVIKTLQNMRKTLLENAQLSTEPPLNVPESMRGKVKIVPRGLNYYEKADQRIYPVDVARGYPITKDDYAMAVRDLDEFYLGDLWMMLERQSAASRMTAYEVSQRLGEKASVLGPVTARNQSEFADPLISMVFNEEMRRGRIPPPPPSLRNFQGAKLVPHYVGPLAVAQRRNGVLDGLMTAMQAITPIAQIRQEALDHLNFDAWVRVVLESSGAPMEVANDLEAVGTIRQSRLQAQQAQMQQQMQVELMKNFRGLSETPGEGSPGYALAQSLGINQPEQSGVR